MLILLSVRKNISASFLRRSFNNSWIIPSALVTVCAGELEELRDVVTLRQSSTASDSRETFSRPSTTALFCSLNGRTRNVQQRRGITQLSTVCSQWRWPVVCMNFHGSLGSRALGSPLRSISYELSSSFLFVFLPSLHSSRTDLEVVSTWFLSNHVQLPLLLCRFLFLSSECKLSFFLLPISTLFYLICFDLQIVSLQFLSNYVHLSSPLFFFLLFLSFEFKDIFFPFFPLSFFHSYFNLKIVPLQFLSTHVELF